MDAITAIPSQSDLKELGYLAAGLAKSDLAPPLFRNNNANCFLAAQYAVQMGLPVLTIMQGMYVPKRGGKVGFTTEFYLGRLIDSRRIVGTIRYEVYRLTDNMLDGRLPDIEVIARVIDAATGEEISERINMQQALAEGWAKRVRLRDGSGEMPSKYETMPEQMLKKRACTWLVRNHYPDVMQSAMERGEIEDVARAEAARYAEVVDTARERAKLPPGTELPRDLQEEAPETPPEDRCTQDQVDRITDWLLSERVDGEAVMEHLRARGHKEPDTLSKADADELLEMIQGEDFAITEE